MKSIFVKALTLAIVTAVLMMSAAALAEEMPVVVVTSAPVEVTQSSAVPVNPPTETVPAAQQASPSADDTAAPVDGQPTEATGAPADSETPANSETPAVSEPPAVSETPADSETPAVSETPEATETPAPSEDPLATDTPEASLEPTETPVPEVPALDLSNVSINTYCMTGGAVRYGDVITVVAEISGLDGVSYGMQWQYFDGGSWNDVSGAHDSSYSFALSKTNATYQWRMVVTIAS